MWGMYMQEKNILNQFKDVLGQYCAVIQFIELSKRCFVTEHEDEICDKKSLVALATRNEITLTNYNSETMVRLISKSYIVNIHLCFETFLKNVCLLMRKYGKNTLNPKNQEESWLEYVVRNITLGKLPPNIQAVYDLCEYYRLVRNTSVHDLCDIKEHKSEYKNLQKYDYKLDAKFKKLTAPNEYNQICFDDFVMFSRSCVELATYIYDNVVFDYEKIVTTAPTNIQSKWRKYGQGRCAQAIRTYVNSNFRIDASFDAQIPYLTSLFTAQ